MLEKEKQRLAEDEPEELDEVISQAPLHPSVKINQEERKETEYESLNSSNYSSETSTESKKGKTPVKKAYFAESDSSSKQNDDSILGVTPDKKNQ